MNKKLYYFAAVLAAVFFMASCSAGEKNVRILMPEEAVFTPEILEYDFESACEKGEARELRGTLPGAAEGIWYMITIDGVEYYYGRYDHSPEKAELFNYAVVSGNYSLPDGLSVGMTKQEVNELYSNLAVIDMEGNCLNDVTQHQGWNGVTYPRSREGMDEKWDYAGKESYEWKDQFDYIMIADVRQPENAQPVYMALMMKEDKVAAITFYCPTAG